MYSILGNPKGEGRIVGDNPLGEYVAARREELRLGSQRDLAALAGVSHGWLSNIERGFDHATGRPTDPSVSKLQQLARALKVDPRVLFDLATGEPPKANVQANLPEAFTKRRDAKLAELDEKKRRQQEELEREAQAQGYEIVNAAASFDAPRQFEPGRKIYDEVDPPHPED